MQIVRHGLKCLLRPRLIILQRKCSYATTRSRSSRAVGAAEDGLTNYEKHETEIASNDVTLVSLKAAFRAYQNHASENLDFESSQGHTRDIGSKLTDRARFRFDFNLWNLLFDHAKLHRGHTGVLDIWYGMRNRAQAVKFNDDEKASKELRWKLIESALEFRSAHLVREFCKRKYSVVVHDDLCSRLVALSLRGRANAKQVEFTLRISHWLTEVEGHELPDFGVLCEVYKPETHPQIRLLLYVYIQMTLGASQYDHVMKYAWKKLDPDAAIFIHRRLVCEGHLPSQIHSLTPLIVYLAEQKADPTLYLHRLEAAGVSLSHQARYLYSIAFASNTHDLDAVEGAGLSDAFVARAFATRLFSFDFVFNSLLAFGLKEIGPQAVRVIGQADPDPTTLLQRFKTIDEHRIDTGTSAYTKLVRTLCITNQPRLLEQLLATDMHHDIFEDRTKQLQLLADQIERGRWQAVNLLVCSLNNGRVDLSAKRIIDAAVTNKQGSENLISRALLTRLTGEDFDSSTNRSRISGSPSFPGQLCKSISDLKTRSAGRVLCTATGTLQDCMLAGQHVSLSTWYTLLSRIMRVGTHKQVRKMCLWIAEWYGPKGLAARISSQMKPVDNDLSRMFGKQFQASVMYRAVGPRFLDNPTEAQRLTFRPAVELLQILHEEYGIFLHSQPLQQFRQRLVVQFRKLIHRSRMTTFRGRTATPPHQLKSIMMAMLKELHIAFGVVMDHKSERLEFEAVSKSLRSKWKRRARATKHNVTPSLITKEFMQEYPLPRSSTQSRDEAFGEGDVILVHTENVHSTIRI